MVRKVNPDADAQPITDIYNEYILNTTVSFETQPLTTGQMRQRIASISAKYPYLVYEHDGAVVGYAYVHLWKERAAYCHTAETTIYLSSVCKHHGIGKSLMSRLIEECRKRGFRMLIACITAENKESIAFHSSLGFAEASHFHNVGEKFGRWLDVVDMEMDITHDNNL